MAVSALAGLAQICLNADGRGQSKLLGETGQDGFELAHGVRIHVRGRGRGFNGGSRIFYQQAGICWGFADPQGQLVATLAQGV